MCRFTNQVQLCPGDFRCVSLKFNLPRQSCSLPVVGRPRKVSQPLCTIAESHEEDADEDKSTKSNSKKQPHAKKELDSRTENEHAPLANKQENNNSQRLTGKVAEDGLMMEKRANENTKVSAQKREKQVGNNFEAFGDFFPADLLRNIKDDASAKGGIRRYIERQKMLAVKLRCREEEQRRINQAHSPEVQAWMQFFG